MHKDTKFTKGMTPAQKKKFDKMDEKMDAKIAAKAKKAAPKKKKKVI